MHNYDILFCLIREMFFYKCVPPPGQIGSYWVGNLDYTQTHKEHTHTMSHTHTQCHSLTHTHYVKLTHTHSHSKVKLKNQKNGWLLKYKKNNIVCFTVILGKLYKGPRLF